MNLKSGTVESFEQFGQFESLKEFNNHMEMWMVEHKADFSKSELVGLKRLVRFSAKVPGVCNAKIGTILKAIHNEYQDLGISRSTFKRMILKAKEFGIITIYETERKNGSQSSNLYVFNRCPISEPPKDEKLNHHNKTSNLLKTTNLLKTNKILKKRVAITTREPTLDHTFTNDNIPQTFIDLVKYFLPDAKTIQEYWRMVRIAAYNNNREKDCEHMLDVSILSFKQLINKIKLRGNVKNPIAYFYGILNTKFEILYFEDLYELGM